MAEVRNDALTPSGATSGKASGPPPAGGDDWPAKLTDTIVGYVATVRNATTGRALVASRAAVYLLAAGLIALVALILVLILVFRLAVELAQDNAWIAYLAFGAAFTLVGLFAWAKKER